MFRIDVVEQRWLTDCETDLCSHGRLSIEIGGVVVADGTEELGISESALGLLRTLDSDRASHEEDDRLIMHGCGAILMMGCPIGIDWDVEHGLQGVRVFNVVSCDGAPDYERRLSIDVVVPRRDYVRVVCALADSVAAFFGTREKQIPDDWDREQYEAFWHEFDERTSRARAEVRTAGGGQPVD
jgi:hypothetical protein